MDKELVLIKEGLEKIRNGQTKRVDYYDNNKKITIYQCGSKVIRCDIKED